MHGGIVEGVAGDAGAALVGVGAAEAGVVVVGPLGGAVELVHAAGIEDICAQGHAAVLVVQEAGIGGCVEPGGGRKPGEVIHNQHLLDAASPAGSRRA